MFPENKIAYIALVIFFSL